MGREQTRRGERFLLLASLVAITVSFFCGCIFNSYSRMNEAKSLAARGNHHASIRKYQEIVKSDPQFGDEALYRLGLLYLNPHNSGRDTQKGWDCFQRLVKTYPQSRYREQANTWIAFLSDYTAKDRMVRTLKKQMEDLEIQIEQMKEIDLTVEKKRKKLQKK